MGFFVDWQGEQGYANGFIVFAGLSLTSIGIMILLRTTRGGVAAAVAAADERAAKKGATVSDAGPGDAAVQPENT